MSDFDVSFFSLPLIWQHLSIRAVTFLVCKYRVCYWEIYDSQSCASTAGRWNYNKLAILMMWPCYLLPQTAFVCESRYLVEISLLRNKSPAVSWGERFSVASQTASVFKCATRWVLESCVSSFTVKIMLMIIYFSCFIRWNCANFSNFDL